jgi:hypothetical protein
MKSDTDFIREVRDYLQSSPHLSAIDVVNHFYASGIPKEKTLYTLHEIFD